MKTAAWPGDNRQMDLPHDCRMAMAKWRESAPEIRLDGRARSEAGVRLCRERIAEQDVVGGAADENVYGVGGDAPLHVAIQKHQVFTMDGEGDAFAFTGIDCDASQSAQLTDRKGNRRKTLVEVKLNGVGSGARPLIGHTDGYACEVIGGSP